MPSHSNSTSIVFQHAFITTTNTPSSSQSLFAERILYIELLYEPIFDASSAATLLRVARTCRVARHAISAYIRVAFDPNRLLARFFPSPTAPCSSLCSAPPPHAHAEPYARARAFRSLQARTGTLVSGSCALQFFDRTLYPESDLDLYVHMRHRREVGRWLLQEGYAYAPTVHQHQQFEVEVVHGMSPREDGIYSMPGVSGILTFTRPAPRRPRPVVDYPENVEEAEGEQEGTAASVSTEEEAERLLKVQIIVTKNTPMEAVLAFHSTCVMNVLTYEKAYCLFPRATLEERRSLLSSSCRGRSKRRSAGLAKYASRGFTLLSALAPDDIELDPAAAASARSTSRYDDELTHAPFLYGRPTALTLVRSNETALLSPTGLLTTGSSSAPSPGPSSTSPSPAPPEPPRARRAAFRLGWRWIDDSASWVLPLPLDGVTPPPAPGPCTPAPTHDPAAVCNWEVRYPARGRARDPGAVMHFEIAAGKVLRYRYLVTDEQLLAFLGRELSARARAEQVKEDAELEEWSYYDWELPALCREFLHGLAGRRLASLRID